MINENLAQSNKKGMWLLIIFILVFEVARLVIDISTCIVVSEIYQGLQPTKADTLKQLYR